VKSSYQRSAFEGPVLNDDDRNLYLSFYMMLTLRSKKDVQDLSGIKIAEADFPGQGKTARDSIIVIADPADTRHKELPHLSVPEAEIYVFGLSFRPHLKDAVKPPNSIPCCRALCYLYSFICTLRKPDSCPYPQEHYS
jgi:hypothetical protein